MPDARCSSPNQCWLLAAAGPAPAVVLEDPTNSSQSSSHTQATPSKATAYYLRKRFLTIVTPS